MEKNEKIKSTNELIKLLLEGFYSTKGLGVPDIEITICNAHGNLSHLMITSKDSTTKCCYDLERFNSNGKFITPKHEKIVKEFITPKLSMLKTTLKEINEPEI